MKLVVRYVCNVAAIWVAAKVLNGFTYGGDAGTLLIAALALTVVNWLIRPIVTVLAIPAIVLSLGVALFFVNLAMLELAAWLVSGFAIDGFWTAVAATIIVWAVNAVLHAVARRRRG